MSTCSKCGAAIENIYYVNGKAYGSTCYKSALRELGIPTGFTQADYIESNILAVVALVGAPGISKFERQSKAREHVSSKAYVSIFHVVKNNANPHNVYNQYVKRVLGK